MITDGHCDLSLDELLVKAGVEPNDYMAALEVSDRGSVIVLKREPNECFINNYNGAVMHYLLQDTSAASHRSAMQALLVHTKLGYCYYLHISELHCIIYMPTHLQPCTVKKLYV